MKNQLLAFIVLFSGVLYAEKYDDRFFEDKYKYLFSEKVQTLSDGSRSFHHGRHFVRDGMNILILHGDSVEMAFQHGALLKEQIPLGAVPLSARMIEDIAYNEFGSPFMANLVNGLIDRFIRKRIEKFSQSNDMASLEYGGTIWGLHAGSGLSTDTISRAALAPDTYMILAALSMKLGGMPVNQSAFGSNCTTFTAWDEYTPDGELVFGRNLDFPQNGAFDRFPTVIYFNPTNGGQRFMGFSSAGVHNAGITGLNESEFILLLILFQLLKLPRREYHLSCL